MDQSLIIISSFIIGAFIIVSFMFLCFVCKSRDKNDNLVRTIEFMDFSNNLMAMCNSIEGTAIWFKDNNDRYIYADDTLRDMLLQGFPLGHVIGKSDLELRGIDDVEHGIVIKQLTLNNLTNIQELLPHNQICNLTDIIVRSIGVSCCFIEIVDGYVLKVLKSPTYRNGKLIGTSGMLWDITNRKNHVLKKIKSLVESGQLHTIKENEIYYFNSHDIFHNF